MKRIIFLKWQTAIIFFLIFVSCKKPDINEISSKKYYDTGIFYYEYSNCETMVFINNEESITIGTYLPINLPEQYKYKFKRNMKMRFEIIKDTIYTCHRYAGVNPGDETVEVIRIIDIHE